MPLVTDANGVASWIDDADLEAAFRAAAGSTADSAVENGTSPAAAHGISPTAVVTNTDVLGVPNPTPASPPLTVEQWCATVFEADVAHALVDGQAVPEDLVADPPRTFRAVMSSLGQWVGSATGAVTRLLARGSYDSIVLAALRPSAVMAQTPSAADYQKGGPPRGGPSQSMSWVGSDQPDSACNTMTRDGSGQTGPACNTQRPPLTFEQWCAKGFEADVAHALVDGQAVPEDPVADPPRTFRAVMSSLGQWVGSATGAVTRLLARG